MDHSNKRQSKAHLENAASELLHEGKKYANEMYDRGLNKVSEKVNEVEESFENYTEDLVVKVRKNPLSSLLIAGGIGFLLSLLIRK